MNNFQKLSETEMEVMEIIWASGHPITSSELLEIFVKDKGKEWKGQTMATFLATLYDGKELTKDEIAELRHWFAEKAGVKNE